MENSWMFWFFSFQFKSLGFYFHYFYLLVDQDRCHAFYCHYCGEHWIGLSCGRYRWRNISVGMSSRHSLSRNQILSRKSWQQFTTTRENNEYHKTRRPDNTSTTKVENMSTKWKHEARKNVHRYTEVFPKSSSQVQLRHPIFDLCRRLNIII